MKWNDINMENNTEEYVNDESTIFGYEIYRNKNIHIRNRIFCEGTLIFDHCCIYYNEPGYNGAIFLIDGAKLKITNSIVICKGMNKNTFITGGGNNIIIDSVTFMDCAFFLRNRRCDFFPLRDARLKIVMQNLST